MELFLSFLFLIIASVFGISIGLILGIKSYLILAIISVCIFILIELYNELVINKKSNKYNTGNIPVPNSQANTVGNLLSHTTSPNTTTPFATQSSTDYHPLKDDANNRFAREKDLEDTKFAIFKHKDSHSQNFEMDKPPFDGLEPTELMDRLNYIYFATANPMKPLSYTDYKTHADKYLDQDGTKLSSGDQKMVASSKAYYPQLSSNGIDTKDCLNYGSDPSKSCFQSPQLFHNIQKIKNNTNPNSANTLSRGVNNDNSNLIIIEDFSNYNPETINSNKRYNPVLFTNAPVGNLDRALDQQSNESINLADNDTPLCRNCKLAVCKNDYCGLQNELFM
jgi:hypothetical protein